VEQGRYGHPAKKATWLYAFGVPAEVLPELRWGADGDGGALVSWCKNNVRSDENRPRVGKASAARTPPEFQAVLLDLARAVKPHARAA
jgi:hypothetical protein